MPRSGSIQTSKRRASTRVLRVRHAQNLYRQIYQVTAESGQILICDHVPFDDSAKSIALYMTEKEQLRALSSAGFESAQTVLSLNGLLTYACEKAGRQARGPD